MPIFEIIHMFDFNPYSALLLPAFINGLLFALLCFRRFLKDKRQADFFLGLLLTLLVFRLSFWMLGFAGWYDSHDGLTSFMFYFPFNTLCLIGPCLYFYFLGLTNRDFKMKIADWPHFILPALLMLLYLGKFTADFLFYRPFPNTDIYQFGTRGPFAELDKSGIVYLLSYGSLFFYFILILFRFRRYKAYLKDNFSDLGRIELGWLQVLIWFTIVALLFLFAFFAVNLVVGLGYVLNWYPYLLLGCSIYYISINGYFYSPVLFRELQFSLTAAAEAPRMVPPPDIGRWKQQLDTLMQSEQPYLDPELNLAMLAKKLGTNTQIVSKVINDGYGQNFNDLVNGLRVKAVIRQFELKAQEKYSLTGIAYDCGFNSKNTFNRAFKKTTGQTPSQFLKQLAGSNHDLTL